MLDVDASVNHVGAGTGTSARVVRVRRGVLAARRNASQAPGDIILRDGLADGEDGILLDILDLVDVSARCKVEGKIQGMHTSGRD